MEAKVLQIEDKLKKSEMDVASLDGFRCRPGKSVDAGIIVDQPNITLYCLDDDHRQAVFVETPPGLDLSEQPFYFLAQYQHSQRLLTVPYETLHALADRMGDRFQRLVLLYSVGRCGSTLVSRAVNRLGSVVSLGEPDVYNNIVVMRPPDGSRDPELIRLLRSCTRLLYKPLQPGTDTFFIKFRAFSIEVGDLMHRAFPSAKVLFLYRNAETWARSAGRSIRTVIEAAGAEESGNADPMIHLLSMMDIMKPQGYTSTSADKINTAAKSAKPPAGGMQFVRRAMPLVASHIRETLKSRLTPRERLTVLSLVIAQQLPLVRNFSRSPLEYLEPHLRQGISPMQLLTLWWLGTMQRYMAMHGQGIPILAVRYETLISEPEAALRAIFQYCGLPKTEATVAEGAFSEDSQRDTPLSRERVGAAKSGNLPPELVAQMGEILRRYPPVQTPDFVVPGTLMLERVSANPVKA